MIDENPCCHQVAALSMALVREVAVQDLRMYGNGCSIFWVQGAKIVEISALRI